MLTIGIPQLYCGASGKKGAYNRQEIGLARAFAALGCRAVVLYPALPGTAPAAEDLEPNVRVLTLPARRWRVHAFYQSWQPLLDEGVNAVHVMGDTSLGVPGLYRFCQKNNIFFYSQLGALQSAAENPLARAVMDLLAKPTLAVYRRSTVFAKTPAVAAQLAARRIACAGVMPVGLDTAIIPAAAGDRAQTRAALGLSTDPNARYLLFVGRLDGYKRPLDLPPLLAALPQNWQAVVIGDGALAGALDAALAQQGLTARCRRIPALGNAAVQGYYHACDVFINLNDQEIFGMSLLEAMYAGCPPVARPAPGPDFIIENGVSGLLVDGDAAALAAAVQRAAADPALPNAARRRINGHFLWRSSAELALRVIPAGKDAPAQER